MPLHVDLRTYRMLSPVDTVQEDFSGGINLRDFPSIGPTDCGGLVNLRVVGTKLVAVRPTIAGTNIAGKIIQEAWWSDTLGCTVARCDDGRLYNVETGVILAGSPAVGAATACWVVDFNGVLVLGSVTAGIYTCTAAGVWALASNAIHPTMLEVWQDKVWAIGDAAFPNRLWACNAGNAAVWTTATDWVDIVEGGIELVSLISTQEQDYQGRPSLLVYKRRAVVRINSANATTGFSYTILGIGTGALGRRAVAADLGVVVAFDDVGLWRTDGLTTPVKVSGKIDPFFGPPQMNMPVTLGGTKDSVVNGIAKNGRFRFACSNFANTGSASAGATIEYDSPSGAICTLDPWDPVAGGHMDCRVMWKKLDRATGLTSLHAINGVGNRHCILDDESSKSTLLEGYDFRSRYIEAVPGRSFNCRRLRVVGRFPKTGSNNNALQAMIDWGIGSSRQAAFDGKTDPIFGQLANMSADLPEVGRVQSVSARVLLGGPSITTAWNGPYAPQEPPGLTPYDKPNSPIQIDKVIVMAGPAGRR